MIGAAFAAVPLYRAFCQATGFDGTVRRAKQAPDHGPRPDGSPSRFDTNVRDLPWNFTPSRPARRSKIGETKPGLLHGHQQLATSR